MANAMVMPKKYFFDGNGNPLAFGKVSTFRAGTTNENKPTYTDASGTTANENPIVLNAEGYAPIFMEGSYYIVVTDADDREIWTEDNVNGETPTIYLDTVLDLQAYRSSNLDDGQAFFVKGYYAIDDGGGGLFFYDSSSSATADSGTILAPDAGVGRFIRIISGDITVQQFGAVGDGVTNDTAAFTAAVAAVTDSTIPTRLVAKGKFLIDLETFWNVTDGMYLDFRGAVFIPSSTDITKIFITIRGRRQGTAAKTDVNAFTDPEMTTALTADAVRGDVSVTLASVTGIQEGDLLLFNSAEKFQKDTNTNSTMEPARVSSVNGSVVYLDAPLLCDYTEAGNIAGGGTGFPSVKLYNTCQNLTIDGGIFQIDNKADRGLLVTEVNNLKTFDMEFRDPLTRGVQASYCSANIHVRHISSRSGTDAANDGSPPSDFGYGILLTLNCYSRCENFYGRRGWHIIDASLGQRDVTISGVSGYLEQQAISAHPDCVSFHVENSTIESQACIHARARYNYIDNVTYNIVDEGSGIEWHEDSYELHITKSRFYGSSGNSYVINATDVLRPTNATVIANSKIIVTGNTFDTEGGNLGFHRGASKFIFTDNIIISDDFAVTVPKIQTWIFTSGTGIIKGNTFDGILGGGNGMIQMSGKAGALWTIKDNSLIGPSTQGTNGDFLQIPASAEDGLNILIENNDINTDRLRYFLRSLVTATFRSVSKNTAISTANDLVVLVQAGTSEAMTVDKFVGNIFDVSDGFQQTASGGSTITITVDSGNVYDNTPQTRHGAAAPTAGAWRRGDFFRNETPAVDGNNMVVLGWLCTVSGTPGTWVVAMASTVSPAT